MDIDKILNNTRLVSALTGVTEEEFLALLPTFTQILREEAEGKKRKRTVGGGANGKIKKRFRSVSDIYRNKNGWDDQLVNVTAGLWNFHLQMT